jgi:hypothetical protein
MLPWTGAAEGAPGAGDRAYTPLRGCDDEKSVMRGEKSTIHGAKSGVSGAESACDGAFFTSKQSKKWRA